MNFSTCSLVVNLRNVSSLLPFVYLPNEWIIFEIVWPSIILFGLTGNVMFVWTVKRAPSLHTSTFVLLAGLSLSDLLVLLSIGFDFILDFLMTPIRHGDIFTVELIYFFLTWFCFISSTFFVTLVSLERYLAICYPIKHHLLKGTKRTIKLICVVFIGSVVCSSMALPSVIDPTVICIIWPLDEKFTGRYPRVIKLLPADEFAFGSVGFQLAQTAVILIITFALTTNCYFYKRILQALRKRKCHNILQTSTSLERSIHQASVMVIANGTIFCLCFTVFLFTMIIKFMSVLKLENAKGYEDIILSDVNYTFVLINASINPSVYFITNNSYRHAFKQTFWMCSKRQSDNIDATPSSISMPMQRRL